MAAQAGWLGGHSRARMPAGIDSSFPGAAVMQGTHQAALSVPDSVLDALFVSQREVDRLRDTAGFGRVLDAVFNGMQALKVTELSVKAEWNDLSNLSSSEMAARTPQVKEKLDAVRATILATQQEGIETVRKLQLLSSVMAAHSDTNAKFAELLQKEGCLPELVARAGRLASLQRTLASRMHELFRTDGQAKFPPLSEELVHLGIPPGQAPALPSSQPPQRQPAQQLALAAGAASTQSPQRQSSQLALIAGPASQPLQRQSSQLVQAETAGTAQRPAPCPQPQHMAAASSRVRAAAPSTGRRPGAAAAPQQPPRAACAAAAHGGVGPDLSRHSGGAASPAQLKGAGGVIGTTAVQPPRQGCAPPLGGLAPQPIGRQGSAAAQLQPQASGAPATAVSRQVQPPGSHAAISGPHMEQRQASEGVFLLPAGAPALLPAPRGAPMTSGVSMLTTMASQQLGGPVWMHQVLLTMDEATQSMRGQAMQPMQPQHSIQPQVSAPVRLPGSQSSAALGHGSPGPFPAVLAALPPANAQPGAAAVAARRQPPTATSNGPGVAPTAAAASQSFAALIDMGPDDNKGRAPVSPRPGSANPTGDPRITPQPAAAAQRLQTQKAAPAHSREAGTAAASAPESQGPEVNGAAIAAPLRLAANAQSRPQQTALSPSKVAVAVPTANAMGGGLPTVITGFSQLKDSALENEFQSIVKRHNKRGLDATEQASQPPYEEQGKGKRSKEANVKPSRTPSGKQNNSMETHPQGSQQRLQQQKKLKHALTQWIMQQQPQQQQQLQPQRAGGQAATAVAPAAAVHRSAGGQAATAVAPAAAVDQSAGGQAATAVAPAAAVDQSATEQAPQQLEIVEPPGKPPAAIATTATQASAAASQRQQQLVVGFAFQNGGSADAQVPIQTTPVMGPPPPAGATAAGAEEESSLLRSSDSKDKAHAASQDKAAPSKAQLRASLQLPSKEEAQSRATPQLLSEVKAQSRASPQLPSEEREGEQRCSQCAVTETPMWRNDSHGDNILCNACGVRLQRQVTKGPRNNSQQGSAKAAFVMMESQLDSNSTGEKTVASAGNHETAKPSASVSAAHQRGSPAAAVRRRPASRTPDPKTVAREMVFAKVGRQLLNRAEAGGSPIAPKPTYPAPTAAAAPTATAASATATDPAAQEHSKLPAAEGSSQAALKLSPHVDAAARLEMPEQEPHVAGCRQRIEEKIDEVRKRGKGSAAAAVPGLMAVGGQATETAGNRILRTSPMVSASTREEQVAQATAAPPPPPPTQQNGLGELWNPCQPSAQAVSQPSSAQPTEGLDFREPPQASQSQSQPTSDPGRSPEQLPAPSQDRVLLRLPACSGEVTSTRPLPQASGSRTRELVRATAAKQVEDEQWLSEHVTRLLELMQRPSEGHVAATSPELPVAQQPGNDSQRLDTTWLASTQSPPPGSDALHDYTPPASAGADVAQDASPGSHQPSQQRQEQATEQLTEEAPENATSQPEQSSAALLDGHHPSQPACQSQGQGQDPATACQNQEQGQGPLTACQSQERDQGPSTACQSQEQGQGPATACQNQEQSQGPPTASQSPAAQHAEVKSQAALADARQPRASPADEGEEPQPVQGEEPQPVHREQLQTVQPGNWLIRQLLVVTGLGGGPRPKHTQQAAEAAGRKRGRGEGSSGGGSQGHDSKRVKPGNECADTPVGGCPHWGGSSPGGHRQEPGSAKPGFGLPPESSSEEQEPVLTPQIPPSICYLPQHLLQPGQKPMSDVANPSQTPAFPGGGGWPTAVDKPSPWNTPAVQPPCSTSLTDSSGRASTQPGQRSASQPQAMGLVTQNMCGSSLPLPTPLPSMAGPTPGVRCSWTDNNRGGLLSSLPARPTLSSTLSELPSHQGLHLDPSEPSQRDKQALKGDHTPQSTTWAQENLLAEGHKTAAAVPLTQSRSHTEPPFADAPEVPLPKQHTI